MHVEIGTGVATAPGEGKRSAADDPAGVRIYPPCHTRIASTGWTSIRTLRVRLSRIAARLVNSRASPAASATRAGNERASVKPTSMNAMSKREFRMESPEYP